MPALDERFADAPDAARPAPSRATASSRTRRSTEAQRQASSPTRSTRWPSPCRSWPRRPSLTEVTRRPPAGAEPPRACSACGAGPPSVSRAGVAGGVALVAAATRAGRSPASCRSTASTRPGIATPVQDRLHFAAFDVTTDGPRRAGPPAQGLDRGGRADDRRAAGSATARPPCTPAPPDDTGEARRPAASRLTLTVGFGPGLFDDGGSDRFGLAARRPGLDDCRSSPATRSTRRAAAATSASRRAPTTRRSRCTRSATWPGSAFGKVAVRWSQLGFGKTSSTEPRAGRPRATCSASRTAPPTSAEDATTLAQHVWVAPGDDRGRLDDRRLVPRRPADPDAHRDLGPRPRCASRRQSSAATKGEGAPLVRKHEHDPDSSRGRRLPRPTTRTSGWRTRTRTAACGCCAAATTSPTAPTASAASTRGCSSSPTSATRHGLRAGAAQLARGRAERVPPPHRFRPLGGAARHPSGRLRR